MAQRGIREYDAKRMLAAYLPEFSGGKFKLPEERALVTPARSIDEAASEHPWIKEKKLVVKPDQLFGKRGKHGLILLNADFDEAKRWIEERMNSVADITGVKGRLTHFLVEPYIEHDEEYYIAIKDDREEDHIYFSTAGGVDIEENWDKVITIDVPIDRDMDDMDIRAELSKQIPEDKLETMEAFVKALYRFYKELYYAMLELNPFTIVNGNEIIPLDTVAKLDDTAAFWMAKKWGDIEFPAPFGRDLTPEEKYIKELDEKSGASMKLTILNPKGRIWTMVAGGGASVIYTDTIVDLGYGNELANYGEYSGNPTGEKVAGLTKIALRYPGPIDAIWVIGGRANFTDIYETLVNGVMAGIRETPDFDKTIPIIIRRAGPRDEEAFETLRQLREREGYNVFLRGMATSVADSARMVIRQAAKHAELRAKRQAQPQEAG